MRARNILGDFLESAAKGECYRGLTPIQSKKDNLLGSLWLISNTVPDVMVSCAAESWQLGSASPSAQRDVSVSGQSHAAYWLSQTASNKSFHSDTRPSAAKETRGETKVALKSFPRAEASHPVLLLPY